MQKIVIHYNNKTTGYFTANYGQRPEDWNKQEFLDNLGWKVAKRYDVLGDSPSEDLLGRVREEVLRLCSNASTYIFQVFLAEEGVPPKPITKPLCGGKNVGKASDVVFINLQPPVPEWVPGEEEEEALLYRGAP
jgi:hypothetical protein